MGRGGEENHSRVIRKIESLKTGIDKEGKRVDLGEKDSYGKVVKFISQDGRTWESVREHDRIATFRAFKEAMLDYQKEITRNYPSAEEVASKVCLDPKNISIAAKEANINWDYIQKRLRLKQDREIMSFRAFLLDLGEERKLMHQDDQEGRFKVYQSKIKGADIFIERITDTPEEIEQGKKRLQEISDRLEKDGFPPIEVSLEEQEGAEQDEFEAIVSQIADKDTIIWSSSLNIPLNQIDHSITIETTRGSEETALKAGIDLEERLIDSPIGEEPLVLKIIGGSIDPEQIKENALEILAKGEKHPLLEQAKAFGLNEDKLTEQMEAIIFGEKEKKSFIIASGHIFTKDLGSLNVTVSAEDIKDIKRYLSTFFNDVQIEENI